MGNTRSTNGEKKILMVKPEGKRPLDKPRRRWLDNIKMGLREVGWGCMDWIDLAQDTLGGVEVSCEHSNEPAV
jgi:hypothetical protein